MTAALEYVARTRRILAGTNADIVIEASLDGEPATPTGTLTFTAVDALGEDVASGSATASGGKVTATLTPAETASPNVLTVTWAGLVFGADDAISLVSTHEVVGSWLFSLSEARAYSGGKLGSTTAYPSARILEARDRITDMFADILGFGLGRRFAMEVLDGTGTDSLWLTAPHVASIRAAQERQSDGTWAAVTGDTVVTNTGRVELLSGAWPRGSSNIRIAYEAGAQPVPLDLKDAALELLMYQMVASDVNARATQQVNEHGQFTLGSGGPGAWFGIADVDTVLTRLRRKLPGIG